jgi:hypothetical protein
MKIQLSAMTIAEIHAQIRRGELTVNHEYQRSPEIWPASAKSYFIDTILAGFPFQKIYIYAHYDDKVDGDDKIKKEIVDGQQRVMTMLEFLNNEFWISTPSSPFKRKHYRDLELGERQRYINTMVEVDLVLQATPSDVLEMFRRINSYMAPLRPAERRHAQWNGKFKWFINSLADGYSPLLKSYGALNARQIIRMGDAEFISELAQVLDVGIVDKSAAALNRIYSSHDKNFDQEDEFREKIEEFFSTLTSTFKFLARTPMIKTYNLYSLFCALMGRKYGFPGSKDLGIKKCGTLFRSASAATKKLKELVLAIEDDDQEGRYGDYIEETLEATTRVATRKPRAVLLAKYLDA